ncbi:MAG: anti-sigma factor family protein [Oceanibaculum sp.]
MKNEDTATNTTPLITEAMLLAYVDDSLAEAQRRAVESRLARDPEMAARVEAYRAQSRALHDMFDRHLAEPLDPVIAGLESELRTAARGKSGLPRRRAIWRPVALAASVALVAFVGGFGGGFGLAEYRGRAPANPVVSSMQHIPVAEKNAGIMPAVGAAMVSPAGFRPPDFSGLGLRLSGERQLGNAKAAVTHLTYERADGRWVSLYVGAADGGDAPLRAIYPDGRSVLSWRKDGLAYSLVGTVDRDAMMAIAATLDDAAAASVRSPIVPKVLPDPATGLPPAKPAEALQPSAIPSAPAITPNPANRPDGTTPGTAPRARGEGAA